ncbi:MAG: hypothetical protein WDO16_17475 [Bacteroidota bacterium]
MPISKHSHFSFILQPGDTGEYPLLQQKELEALSDLERVEYLKQLIDGFTKDNPLKRYKGEIYYDLHNLAGLFSAIKREGWEKNGW